MTAPEMTSLEKWGKDLQIVEGALETPNIWICSVHQGKGYLRPVTSVPAGLLPVYDDSENFLSSQEGGLVQMIKRQDLFPQSTCSP